MAAGSWSSRKRKILVFLDAIRPAFLRLRRKYEIDESYWLVRRWRSFLLRAVPALHRAALSFSHRALLTLRISFLSLKWGRVPRVWELSFIDRMKELEKAGCAFNEVLRSTLPQFFGADPSGVLRSWVGRKARRNPERFARTVSKMFGTSARSILGNIERLADEESLLAVKAPKEPAYKSLLEAIERSDAAMAVVQPDKPKGRP
jgi:signal transduction histidine kinase